MLSTIVISDVMVTSPGKVAESRVAEFPAMKAYGLAGERLRACVGNQVAAKDPAYLAFPFTQKTETGSWGVLEPGIWQTEFWGKYMHAAVPMADLAADADWKARIGESVKTVLASQLPDGYIGNYRDDKRGDVCDVWGAKYVMLGLLHWYDSTGNRDALKGAEKLSGWVMSKFGPGRRSLGAEGPFCGLMNCSVLEPIVWLYRRTGDRRYLDYAKWIVSELDSNRSGPELIPLSLAKVPLKDRHADKDGHKSYEMMSCCQGLLDYYIETGDSRCFDAARSVAESVIKEELDITGGGTQCERFCGYAKLQTHDRRISSETCVLITWMRLCEKLLTVTGNADWADELEKTFYNAYLAALSADGSEFSSYGALCGTRERLHPQQCRMRANCCDANGPRGFVSFFHSSVTSCGNEVSVNQYVHGIVKVPCSASKSGYVVIDQFNDYPRKLRSAITLALDAPATFTLRFRAPAWSDRTTVKAADGETKSSTEGGYVVFAREWKPGDQIEVVFDCRVKRHVAGDFAAFTRGPLVLARDVRFHDGDLSESIADETPVFTDTLPPAAAMYLAATALVKTGVHEVPPRPVGFCDFASAGNSADAKSFFRVWLPVYK